MATGLCIIFNHPFAAQLPLLREIHGRRFEKILFLHPLDASAAAADVCVVYGGGFTFDAMIAAAHQRILKEFEGYDCVLFIHNDVLPNPSLTSKTVIPQFQVEPGTILTCGVAGLSHALDFWSWGFRAAANFADRRSLFAGGAEAAMSFLPDLQTAQAKARAADLDDTTFVYPAKQSTLDALPPIFQNMHDIIFGHRKLGEIEPVDLHYPLFTGYSDFFAVSASVLPKWLEYVGVLSSMLLFAEVAVPTASVLAAEKLAKLTDLGWGMQTLWGQERGTVEDLNWLWERFAAKDAFIHPLKWNLMTEAFLAELRLGLDKTLIGFTEGASPTTG